jgi:hypothetical protein
MNKYIVKLSQQERHDLHQLIAMGRASARRLMHARILLKADQGEGGPAWSDERISQALEVSSATIGRVRQRLVEGGLDDALNRRPQPARPSKRKVDGACEAHLIALTCGEKPEGQGRWSLRLLADKLVELGEVEQISHETVRQVLKKTNSSPGSKSSGVSRPKPMRTLWLIWKMYSPSTPEPMTRAFHRSAWMK